MAAQPVPARGRFLGSIGALFRRRKSGDIFLQNYHISDDVYMVCFESNVWGHTVVYVERAQRNENGQLGAFRPSPISLARIRVEDQGPVFPAGTPQLPVDDFQAYYYTNGELYIALNIPWHHRTVLRKAVGDTTPFYWHKTKRRSPADGFLSPPVLPGGPQFTFNSMRLAPQVQVYRLALP